MLTGGAVGGIEQPDTGTIPRGKRIAGFIISEKIIFTIIEDFHQVLRPAGRTMETQIYSVSSFPRKREPSRLKHWIPAFARMTNKSAFPYKKAPYQTGLFYDTFYYLVIDSHTSEHMQTTVDGNVGTCDECCII
jgi:hypothetical protein